MGFQVTCVTVSNLQARFPPQVVFVDKGLYTDLSKWSDRVLLVAGFGFGGFRIGIQPHKYSSCHEYCTYGT